MPKANVMCDIAPHKDKIMKARDILTMCCRAHSPKERPHSRLNTDRETEQTTTTTKTHRIIRKKYKIARLRLLTAMNQENFAAIWLPDELSSQEFEGSQGRQTYQRICPRRVPIHPRPC